MRDLPPTHSINRHDRPAYGAVPLDPWRATYVDDVNHWNNLYVTGSNTRIERRLTRSMVDGEWFKHVPQAHDLYDFMNISLRDSQNRRIEMNGRTQLTPELAKRDDRVAHALEGTAMPDELFTLLVDLPELQSLELAKLSHPFDFQAPHQMDRELDELMLDVGGELLDSEPRYKIKRTDLDIPAAMILRKQDLMDFPVDDQIVRITQRQGFMVYQGNGMRDEPHFDRLLKNPKNHPALFAWVEHYISDPNAIQPFGWVQPQASSYYAKVVKTNAA